MTRKPAAGAKPRRAPKRAPEPAPPVVPDPPRPLGTAGKELWTHSYGPWLRSDTDRDWLLALCEQQDERVALRFKVLKENDWRERAALRAVDAQVITGLQALSELRRRHAMAKDPPPPTANDSNYARITELLGSLRRAGPMDTTAEALGQVALTLAEQLDLGAGMGTASVARELRATIADLMKGRDADDDDDFFAGVPAPVWDTQEPRPPNAG